jgi:hypothetical protein
MFASSDVEEGQATENFPSAEYNISRNVYNMSNHLLMFCIQTWWSPLFGGQREKGDSAASGI